MNNEIMIKINTLKELRDEIQSKIDLLEKEFNQDVDDKLEKKDSEKGYHDYLTVEKKLNEHTAQNYFGHLRGIKLRLEKYNGFIIESEIYNITSVDTLLDIKKHMFECNKLIEDNKIQHNAFTAAFNNYFDYIVNFFGVSDIVSEPNLNSSFVLDE